MSQVSPRTLEAKLDRLFWMLINADSRAEERAQQLKCLLHKYGLPSLDPRTHIKSRWALQLIHNLSMREMDFFSSSSFFNGSLRQDFSV